MQHWNLEARLGRGDGAEHRLYGLNLSGNGLVCGLGQWLSLKRNWPVGYSFLGNRQLSTEEFFHEHRKQQKNRRIKGRGRPQAHVGGAFDGIARNTQGVAATAQSRLIIKTSRRVDGMLKAKSEQIKLSFRRIFDAVRAICRGRCTSQGLALWNWSFKQADENKATEAGRNFYVTGNPPTTAWLFLIRSRRIDIRRDAIGGSSCQITECSGRDA